MNQSASQGKIYFEHLDVIRFLAAFMIIILHGYESWCSNFGEIKAFKNEDLTEFTSFGGYLDQFIKNFGFGVDIFFLLSGFLITYILLEEKKRFNTIQIGKFMIRRSLRIWPLYFLLIAIAPFLVSWMGTPEPNYLANALFFGNFDIIQSQAWLYPFAHFWTICIEEHFYLVWPFVIFLIPRKFLIWTFILLIVGSIAFRTQCLYTASAPWYTLFLHTFSRIDVIVIGAIGALFYSKKPFEFRLPRLVRILVLAIFIASLCITSVWQWDTIYSAMFKKYIFISLVAILLLDYNFNPRFKHFLPKKSFIHYLGKISYGVYMYGNIVLLIIIEKIMLFYKLDQWWVFVLLVLSISILVPIISYELFEKQLLKLNARFRMIKTDR